MFVSLCWCLLLHKRPKLLQLFRYIWQTILHTRIIHVEFTGPANTAYTCSGLLVTECNCIHLDNATFMFEFCAKVSVFNDVSDLGSNNITIIRTNALGKLQYLIEL